MIRHENEEVLLEPFYSWVNIHINKSKYNKCLRI